jgi:hypothetical protein
MSWGSLTTKEVEEVAYLSGHLAASENYPDDAHAGDSRDLALDGFAELKTRWIEQGRAER